MCYNQLVDAKNVTGECQMCMENLMDEDDYECQQKCLGDSQKCLASIKQRGMEANETTMGDCFKRMYDAELLDGECKMCIDEMAQEDMHKDGDMDKDGVDKDD